MRHSSFPNVTAVINRVTLVKSKEEVLQLGELVLFHAVFWVTLSMLHTVSFSRSKPVRLRRAMQQIIQEKALLVTNLRNDQYTAVRCGIQNFISDHFKTLPNSDGVE